MGGLGAIKDKLVEFGKLENHFNVIGQFYLRVQFLFRVLVVIVFLDDLFEEVSLECETAQFACDLVCENRFAPVMIYQIWTFELFIVLLSTCIFLLINVIHTRKHKKMLKYYEKCGKNPMMYELDVTKFASDRFDKKQKFKDGQQVEVITSVYTQVGYLSMLFFRLFVEVCCIVVEASLNQHMSQNEMGNFLDLKEHWKCLVNQPSNSGYQAGLIALPSANRSAIWHREDPNLACITQEAAVKCWIPFSRNKALGLKLMFGVICMQTVMTFLEICLELFKMCSGQTRGLGAVRSQYMQDLQKKARVH